MSSRLVCLHDSDGMGGEVVIFKTNAPQSLLRELESEFTDIEYEDAEPWYKLVEAEGYSFDYIDSTSNVTAYHTSKTWLEDNYPDVDEHYYITYI